MRVYKAGNANNEDTHCPLLCLETSVSTLRSALSGDGFMQ